MKHTLTLTCLLLITLAIPLTGAEETIERTGDSDCLLYTIRHVDLVLGGSGYPAAIEWHYGCWAEIK